ncbi:hypothetical protein GQ600_15576 [Phytophthora cactorum]|nr:hypothetical protein GQ600_15576 [Phytophthora cactorum]
MSGFPARWAELKKEGWDSKKPVGLSDDYTYLKPGKTQKDIRETAAKAKKASKTPVKIRNLCKTRLSAWLTSAPIGRKDSCRKLEMVHEYNVMTSNAENDTGTSGVDDSDSEGDLGDNTDDDQGEEGDVEAKKYYRKHPGERSQSHNAKSARASPGGAAARGEQWVGQKTPATLVSGVLSTKGVRRRARGETTFYCGAGTLPTCSKLSMASRMYLCNKHTVNDEAVSCFEIWHKFWQNGTLLLPSKKKGGGRVRRPGAGSTEEETGSGKDSDDDDDAAQPSQKRRRKTAPI